MVTRLYETVYFYFIYPNLFVDAYFSFVSLFVTQNVFKGCLPLKISCYVVSDYSLYLYFLQQVYLKNLAIMCKIELHEVYIKSSMFVAKRLPRKNQLGEGGGGGIIPLPPPPQPILVPMASSPFYAKADFYEETFSVKERRSPGNEFVSNLLRVVGAAIKATLSPHF